MKPTRDTAYLTIVTSIISALVIMLTYFTQNLSFAIREAISYVLSFIPIVCFIWLMIFVISILKYTNEKPLVVNTFIIYLIYTTLFGLLNFGVRFLGLPIEKMMAFYQVNGFINLLAVICLVVMVFLLRPTEFRLPLRVFALSELFILVFYMVVPPLLTLSGNSAYDVYTRYLGIVPLIIPAVGLYIAITTLNIINKRQWQKPFYEMDKPDWPPYDKPNL